MSPSEGYDCDLRTGTSLLGGQAEGAGLFSLEKRHLEGHFISVYQHVKGGYKEDGSRLFLVVPSNRTKGNRQKQTHSQFHLIMGKSFFIV